MFSLRGFGHMLAKHWLGSANFFSDYGRYSTNSRMGDDTCRAIIEAWRSGGGSKFDCSYSYNNIPEILPFVSKKDCINIKFPVASFDFKNVKLALDEICSPIIDAARLVSVMVHDADAVDPQVTLDFLATAQERFEHRDIKFGASVYSVELAELLVRAGNCDVIQASVNILDQRFLTENMQKIFTDHGVELMARSVFLQGLLVDLPMAKMHFKQFGKRDILDLHSWFAEKNVNPSRACLNFVSNHQAVDSVVLGFASSDQVHGAAKAISEEIKLLQELQEMASNDSTIIDAREW